MVMGLYKFFSILSDSRNTTAHKAIIRNPISYLFFVRPFKAAHKLPVIVPEGVIFPDP